MSNLISEAEVISLVFNRNIQYGTLKQTHIDVAEMVWGEKYLGSDFYKLIVASPSDYTDLIEGYYRPLVAWGTLYQSFEYLSTQITEKGIIQMLGEGTANLLDRTTRGDMKLEIRHICLKLAEKMQTYCAQQHEALNPLFADYEPAEISTVSFGYYGKLRMNQTPY
jgi:hypothetical protein